MRSQDPGSIHRSKLGICTWTVDCYWTVTRLERWLSSYMLPGLAEYLSSSPSTQLQGISYPLLTSSGVYAHTQIFFFSFCWNIFSTIRKHNKVLGSHFELVRAPSSGGDGLYFESWVSDKCYPENTYIIVQRHSQDSASSKACGRAPSLFFPACGCCCYSVVIPSFIAAWLQSVFVITWHSPCVTNFIWLSFCKNINLFKLVVHSTPVWPHIVWWHVQQPCLKI